MYYPSGRSIEESHAIQGRMSTTRPIDGLPSDINCLYEESRCAFACGYFTSTVMLCRKILMNAAVNKNAPTGLNFLGYIDYFIDHGFIGTRQRGAVDRIRVIGNIANHEIHIISEDEAKTVLKFTEWLLETTFKMI